MGDLEERKVDGVTYELREDLCGHTHAWTTTEDVLTPRNVALVGCGTWGKNLLRNLGERVGAVIDPDTKAKSWAFEVGRGVNPYLWICKDIADVLGEPWIKAVAIATPPASHFEIAMAALAKGKHVFVEKPLALTVAEGEVLVGMAERRGLVLMVGHLMRYHPGFVALQELVKSGKLGDLRYLYAVRGKLGGVRREPDVLWSFAPHDISMILALVGKMPFKVQAMGGAYLTPGVPDVTAVDLDFGDVQANLFVNWLHPVKEQRLVVVGDKGIAVFRDGAGADTLVVHPYEVDGREPVPGEPYQVPVAKAEPLALEVREFLNCVDAGMPPLTDGAEGLRVLQVLEDAQRSMRESRPVFQCGMEKINWVEQLLEDLGLALEVNTSRFDAEIEKAKQALWGPDWAEELVCELNEIRDYTALEGNQCEPDIQFRSEDCCDTVGYTVHPLAEVETDDIGDGTTIWRWTHVMEGASIGRNCMIGQGCFIGRNVRIGDGCRIQNGAQLFDGVTLEDGVFIGPGVVFTNDRYPRAGVDGLLEGTIVRAGAAIGANATIRCGFVIGAGATVGAGAVVTRPVKCEAVVAGNPAREL